MSENSEAATVDDANNLHNPLAGVVEISPNRRYIRFDVLLPRSKNSNIQSSYKAFDTKNGIEVIWHIINLNSLQESDQSRVIQSVQTVKDIQNKYITEFLSQWFDKASRSLNIITTDLSTLKEFINTVIITLRWRIVKKWCKQILSGLNALHSCQPGIVHRNIACAHIYIDSGLGETKIGDLWLSHVLDDSALTNRGLLVPESLAFTAPEILSKQSFTSKADIYSFGLCVAEMITREEPYRECAHMTPSQLKRHIIDGNLPFYLQKIPHSQAKSFIEDCLRPPDDRPTAETLLAHEFLVNHGEADDGEVILNSVQYENLNEAPNNGIDAIQRSSLDTPLSREFSESLLSSPISTVNTPHPRQKDSINEKHIMAELGQSENVHNDKGIHDGRRTGVEDYSMAHKLSGSGGNTRNFVMKGRPTSERITSPVPSLQSPVSNSELSSTNVQVTDSKEARSPTSRELLTLPISCTVCSVVGNKLQLIMTIPAKFRSTSDQDDQESLQVEFDFDTNYDQYESVAAEMVSEIDLKSTAEEIANIIRSQVESCLSQKCTLPVSNSDSAVANSSASTDSDQNISHDNNSSAEVPSSIQFSKSSDVIAESTSVIQDTFVSRDDIDKSLKSVSDLANPLSSECESVLTDAQSESPKYDVPIPAVIEEPILKSDDQVGLSSLPKPDEVLIEAPAPSSLEVASRFTSNDERIPNPLQASPEYLESNIPPSDSSQTDRETSNEVSCDNSSLINNPETPGSPSKNIPSFGKPLSSLPNQPTLKPSGESTDADEAIRDSIDKLDKEARVAKRTFQQRIQKHQSIQENCEEEIQELDNQQDQKMSDIIKKEELSNAKRDEELSKLKQEFDEKVQKIRKEKLVRLQYMKQQQLLAQQQQQQLLIQQQQQHQQVTHPHFILSQHHPNFHSQVPLYFHGTVPANIAPVAVQPANQLPLQTTQPIVDSTLSFPQIVVNSAHSLSSSSTSVPATQMPVPLAQSASGVNSSLPSNIVPSSGLVPASGFPAPVVVSQPIVVTQPIVVAQSVVSSQPVLSTPNSHSVSIASWPPNDSTPLLAGAAVSSSSSGVPLVLPNLNSSS